MFINSIRCKCDRINVDPFAFLIDTFWSTNKKLRSETCPLEGHRHQQLSYFLFSFQRLPVKKTQASTFISSLLHCMLLINIFENFYKRTQ